MAAGERSLERTPTWAVATVCLVLILISVIIEHIIHLIARWLKKKHKRALYESLEKLKSELMLLGFISLLLTVTQALISRICVSEEVADTWHPCSKEQEEAEDEDEESNGRRRLLAMLVDSGMVNPRRVLAGGGGSDKCAAQGQVAFVSSDGIHQLHIFIFVLAVFHVLYCILTLAFGRLKMRKWKHWEEETKTLEYQFSHDPERFRFAKDTSFGRRHLSFWTKTPILIWIVCFFRQFVRSVPKVDYLTLRHGFMMAHLGPQSHGNFDFQKYINRSLEEDFKVVVGISPPFWAFAVLFIIFHTNGWYSYLWFPFIPLIIILLVGSKLQVIITKMGVRIQERGDVVRGVPVVQPADDLFWFNRPRLILHLINFVLFQNAFQMAFFSWSSLQFGLRNCFHSHTEYAVIRITMGVVIQILCSYVTLPLYALVTQMGSSMKATIFNEAVVAGLRNWHRKARREVKRKRGLAGSVGSTTTSPTTPMSPLHLLRYYRSEVDSIHSSPRRSSVDADSSSPFHETLTHTTQLPSNSTTHQIDIGHTKEFSFDKRIHCTQ